MAADVVSLSLARIAFVHRTDTAVDIGADFHCELRDGDEPTGQFFTVQCKALPARNTADNGDVAISVRVTTARYWMIQPGAALVIVADPETGTLFWTDAKAQLTKRTDEWREQSEVTVAVARTSAFACFAPPPTQISELARGSLRDLGTTLQERLHTERAMLKSVKRIGVDGSSHNVSRRLEVGTAADIGNLIESVEGFRAELATLIVKRIAVYTSALRARVTDTFIKSKLISGPTYDPASDPSYLDLIKKISMAESTSNASTPPSLDVLVSALKSVEDVHDLWWTLHEEVENEVNARATMGPNAGFTSRTVAAAFWDLGPK